MQPPPLLSSEAHPMGAIAPPLRRNGRRSACVNRSGTILIIVSGIAGLLSSMAVVLMVTVRRDLDDMSVLIQESQARNMLSAACDYIEEASRIGWDAPYSPASTQTEFSEAAGWIDVRDGELGPRLNTAPYTTSGFSNNTNPPQQSFTSPDGVILGTHQTPPDYNGIGAQNFPIGIAKRFPMYVMVQPPYAIKLTAAYNPVQQTAPDNGQSFLRFPDPQPVIDNGYASGAVTADNFAAWAAGDRTPRENSCGMSWFRLVREGSGAVFTVTCGAGGTLGYRTWSEVQADGISAEQQFNNDQNLFTSLSDDEVRLWYRVEWSPATTAIDMGYLYEGLEQDYILGTHNFRGAGSINSYSGAMMAPNMGGNIQWIQRLATEPPYW